MATIEQIHRYPRRIGALVELVVAVAAIVAIVLFVRDLLRIFWETQGVAPTLLEIPMMRDVVLLVNGSVPTCCSDLLTILPSLIPDLILLSLALLLVVIVQTLLPTVRTSARGILVEFAGTWLPIPWESIVEIKVTEANERYIMLIQTDGQHLVGWHRLYSFLYCLDLRPAFLVSSSISEFDNLVRTLLSETDRVARVLDRNAAKLREEASSPFFRFILSPGAFFSQKQKPASVAGQTATPASGVQVISRGQDDVVAGTYGRPIQLLLGGGATLLQVLVIARAVALVLVGLALLFPVLAPFPPFSLLELRIAGPAWWPLVAAVLVLLIGLSLVSLIRGLLPEVAARRDGLAVRYGKRWVVIPWQAIQAVKVTELSETSQIVIIQAKSKQLPWVARFSSWIYDGSNQPGVMITSAFSTFEPLLQRLILEVMGSPTENTSTEQQIFQSEARSDFLMLLLSPTQAFDLLVEELRADSSTLKINDQLVLRQFRPMLLLAAFPPLILLIDRCLQQLALPDGRVLIAMLFMLLLGVLELPIVAMVAPALDKSTGGGEEGARPWYLYALSQLPRVMALIGILIITLLGVPFLPALAWLGLLVWIFVLAGGLWSALYDWRQSLLLTGSLIPVFWQLITLIGFLLFRR